MASYLIAPETMRGHRARWFVYVGEGATRAKIPHTATMRGQWGYDVTCSCGEFETRTGGATRKYIEDELWMHRYSAQSEQEGN